MQMRRPPFDVGYLYSVIKRGVEDGFTNDITFTGGEPLLQQHVIIEILQRLESDHLFPMITIGTNAVLLKEHLTDALRSYQGKSRFNISLHSTNPDMYQKITGSGRFDDLERSIRLIASYGLSFKFNSVLLAGRNDALSDIESMLTFAIKHGAESVKFLELMITEGLHEYYKDFCEIDVVWGLLKSRLRNERILTDRKIYKYENTNLNVELQQCLCRVGCKKCRALNGRLFTGGLVHFPCFLLPEKRRELNSENLEEVFQYSDRVMEGNHRRYRNGSPLILSAPVYGKGREEHYYHPLRADATLKGVQVLLVDNGYRLRVIRSFHEQYYAPAPDVPTRWMNFELNWKLQWDNPNPHKFTEIIHRTEFIYCDDAIYSQVTFANPDAPATYDDREKVEKEYQILGLKPSFALQWDVVVFEKDGTNDISIGYNHESGCLTLLCYHSIDKKLQKSLQLSPLQVPLLKHLGMSHSRRDRI